MLCVTVTGTKRATGLDLAAWLDREVMRSTTRVAIVKNQGPNIEIHHQGFAAATDSWSHFNKIYYLHFILQFYMYFYLLYIV